MIDPRELRRRFPKASGSFIAANSAAGDSGKATKLERRPAHEPVGAVAAKEGHSGRHLVRLLCIRKRLLDEDNTSEKYAVDALRYNGILPRGDAPEAVSIQVAQRKANKGEEERVIIEVFELPGTNSV